MLPRYLSYSCDLCHVFSTATSLEALSLVYLQVTRWCSQTYSWIFLVHLCLHFHGYSYIQKEQRMPACITGCILGDIAWLNVTLVAITLYLKQKRPWLVPFNSWFQLESTLKKKIKVCLDHSLLFRHWRHSFFFMFIEQHLLTHIQTNKQKKAKKNQTNTKNPKNPNESMQYAQHPMSRIPLFLEFCSS